jgi:4-amino-4-deoxy-L-arabinose transferase-like glycosyltransferase
VAGLIYVLGARLFGEWPGVLGAGLWLTTPVFVGFGHVGSIDIAFALVTLLVSLALLSYLEKASDRRALWLGLALCAALLTRHIALVLLAVGVIVVVAHSWRAARRTAFRHAGIVAGVAWAGVWVAFRVFSPTGTGGAAGERLSGIISAGRGDSALVRVALAVPWPKEWAAGLAFGVLSTANQPAYLLGQSWTGGKWWFFLGSLVVKLPLIALVVLVVGPFAWRKVPHEARVKAFIVLVVPAVALYVAITAQALDRGLRYAFPIAALWFVAAGPIALLGTPTWRRVGAAVLVATQLAAFTVAFPHSIAWTPPPFQPGYRWASDSNIDFSQDTRLVDEWADGREPLVDLLLPRGFDPPPGSRPLLDVEPSDVRGWVAVSATRLTELDRDELSWLRAYCPVDTIGGSVLIYRFDGPVDATPGPTMPAAECDGEVSVRTD